MSENVALSPQQRRLWSLTGEADLLRARAAIRIEGELDPQLLERALARLVELHEILRTSFEVPEWSRVPHQVVRADGGFPCRREDLTGLGAAEERRRRAEAFDLTDCRLDGEERCTPLATLLRSAESRHHLILDLPAMASDLESLALLPGEIGRIYEDLRDGGPEATEPLQYADFSVWQRELVEAPGEDRELLRAFWAGWSRKAISDPAPQFVREAGPKGRFEAASVPLPLDPETEKLLLARHHEQSTGARPSLLAAWQLYLARITGRPEVAVGCAYDGRVLEDLEDAQGLYQRYLPVRGSLIDDPAFSQLVGRVVDSLAEASGWQEYGVPEDALGGDDGAAPFAFLFETVSRRAPESFGGLSWAMENCRADTELYQLKLSWTEGSSGLELHYDASRVARPDAVRTAAGTAAVLAQALAHSDRRVSRIEAVDPWERHRLTVELNATGSPTVPPEPVHRLFQAQARRHPRRVALVCEDRELTYRDLDGLSDHWARRLRSLGVTTGHVVALAEDRSLEVVVGLVAVLKAGAAYLPLDVTAPPQRQAAIVQDAGVRVVLSTVSHAPEFPGRELPVLEIDLTTPMEHSENVEPGVEVSPQDLAYVIFTSGSTGRPKGVAVEHRQLSNYLAAAMEVIDPPAGGSFAWVSAVAADLGNTMLFPSLAHGGTLHLVSTERASDPAALAEYFERFEIDCLKIVPSHLAALLQIERPERLLPRQRLVLGGEAASPALKERLAECAPPDLRIFNHYGPTETTVGVSVWPVELEREHQEPWPIGRPLGNVRLYVLDAGRRPLPACVPGELHVGGANVARGYLGRPATTAEVFVPDPFAEEPSSRMYRTGDLAVFDRAGELRLLGRVDHQVKLRGHRVELGEVEAYLRRHHAVAEAVATLRSDRREPQLVAYVVPRPGRGIEPGSLQDFVTEGLPEAMRPTAIVDLPGLPLTPNGKVDRATLPDPADASEERARGEAPATPVECDLVAIWERVLGLEEVGVDVNFFELGGDSILAIQVVAQANRAGLRLRPQQLFQHQTVRDLAEVVELGTAPEAQQTAVTGEAPLTPVQHWLFAQQLAAPHHWNQALLLEARDLDAGALHRAMAKVVEHHDALRHRFVPTASGWRQQSPPPGGPAPATHVDLSRLPPKVREAAIDGCASDTQTGFSLEQGPVIRALSMELGEGQALVLLAAHHLVVDGVSWRVLLEDLETCHRQAREGAALELPHKTTSFLRWAERLAEYADSDELAEEIPYWEKTAGASSGLPVELPGGDNTVASAERVTVELDEDETRGLLQNVTTAYRCKIDEALLGALVQTLCHWSGENVAAVEMEGHGREELFDDVELSRTVGWFSTHYPVAVQVPPRLEKDPDSAVREVKEAVRRIPRRGIGYGLLRFLRDDPAVARRVEPSAGPDVTLNYLGQVDGSFREDSAFRPLRRSPGPLRGPRGRRRRPFSVTGTVVKGRLRLVWHYSRNLHHRDTVVRLADSFAASLRVLVDRSLEGSADALVPSDFLLARLDREELESVVAQAAGLDGSTARVEDVYPLSGMQEGILFHSLYSPESKQYFRQWTGRVGEGLDLGLLREALQAVVQQHPILRTCFVWEGLGEPVQVVMRRAEVPLRVSGDWEDLDEPQVAERLREFLEEDRRNGFVLSRAPLMRLQAFRLRSGSVRLVWSFHHLLLDGWSFILLTQRVFQAYAALQKGEPVPTGGSRRYRDYISWLQSQDLEDAEPFWRRYLEGFTSPTPLLPARSEADVADLPWRRDSEDLSFTPEEQRKIEELLRAHRATPNSLVQLAWGLVQGRYTGSDDVVFGATVSGRPTDLEGFESMIGLFVNTLPVRVRFHGSEPAQAALQRVQREHAEARRYEYSPLLRIHGWSEVPSSEALFQSILVFENYGSGRGGGQEERPRDLAADDVRLVTGTNYPLSLLAWSEPSFHLRVNYDARRLAADDARRHLNHVQRVILAIAEVPEQPLDSISLITVSERRRLMEWAAGEELEAEGTVYGCFAACAESRPEALAVVDGERRVSYCELAEMTDRLARRLAAAGAGPEVAVGLAVERSVEMVAGFLAIFRVGAVAVPLDLDLPMPRLAFIAEDAGIRVLLGRGDHLRAATTEGIETVDVAAVLEEEGGEAPPDSPVSDPDRTAYVIYTSGSTGTPKGVAVPEQALVDHLIWCRETYPLQAGNRILLNTSLSFDAALREILGPLTAGAALVVVPPARESDSSALVELIAEAEVTFINLVPSLLTGLLEEPAFAECTRLDTVICGGEALPSHLRDRFLSIHSADLFNHYGPTETTLAVVSARCRPGESPVPIGRPQANTHAYVLDADAELVPPGIPGELWIGGDGLAYGYVGRPGLTADRFRPDPFGGEPGDRLYRTGDLVRHRADGVLEFLRRLDDQVKVRGFRVELGEVEAVLRDHPSVAECAVVVVGSEEERRLVAFVVSKHDPSPSAVGELRRHVRGLLPSYMVPSSCGFLDRLPRTVAGKLDRRALREERLSRPVAAKPVAPRSAAERVVAEIWSEVLGLEEIGVHDDFFELGGHSLTATRVVARVRGIFQVELPVRQLFEGRTVHSLVDVLCSLWGNSDTVEEIASTFLEIAELPEEEAEKLLQGSSDPSVESA